MNKSLIEKLQKLGYKGQTSDELLSELPRVVWITASETNLQRKKAFYSLLLKDDHVIFSISVQDEKDGEVYTLHQEKDKLPILAIARLIVFIETHKMTDSTS